MKRGSKNCDMTNVYITLWRAFQWSFQPLLGLELFFFGFFFMVEGGAHKFMLFLEGWGCRSKYFHFYGFWRVEEACWAPSILKKNKKKWTCTHPNLPSTLNPPKTIKDQLVLTHPPKTKKQRNLYSPPNPLKGEKKIVHKPQTPLPFPPKTNK
jgi:hypothetical protein